MADEFIGSNPAAATLTGTEGVPVVQSGALVIATAQDIADLAGGGGASGLPPGGTAGQRLAKIDGTDYNAEWVDPSVGDGDVVGPAGATNLRIAVFDGTTGKLLADGGQTIAEVLAAALAAVPDAYTIVTEASPFTADPGTNDGLAVYNRCGGDVTFDSAEPYTAGMVFNIRATGALELIEDGTTLTPPAGGTLELDAGMAVQVVFTSATEADVIGQTVAAP